MQYICRIYIYIYILGLGMPLSVQAKLDVACQIPLLDPSREKFESCSGQVDRLVWIISLPNFKAKGSQRWVVNLLDRLDTTQRLSIVGSPVWGQIIRVALVRMRNVERLWKGQKLGIVSYGNFRRRKFDERGRPDLI